MGELYERSGASSNVRSGRNCTNWTPRKWLPCRRLARWPSGKPPFCRNPLVVRLARALPAPCRSSRPPVAPPGTTTAQVVDPGRRRKPLKFQPFSPACPSVASRFPNWDRSDSNREPRDYAYHFGFRRPFRVRGLDHTFTLRVCRLVSTPSAQRQLGSGSACPKSERSLPRVWQILPRPSSTKAPATRLDRPCRYACLGRSFQVPCSDQLSYGPLKSF
jgi:hypothetical protein